jgi:putative ABC transport system substrate-binding protein
MKRRRFIELGAAALVSAPARLGAQPTGNLPRIGFLNNLNPDTASANTTAFQQGLRDLGWIEGKNVLIDYRWADGDMTRHAALAADLVKERVAVIVTAGPVAVHAAQQATRTIPIVVTIMSDPIALGVAASLAHPGGNVTGLANLFEELTPKQLEMFREVLPDARRIALLSDRSMVDTIQAATEVAARSLHLDTQVVYANDDRDLDAGIRTAKQGRADGVLVLPSPAFNRFRGLIAASALRHKLPTFSESSEYVTAGGFLSYGPSFPYMYYRAASYVDRILKGAKAGDLPIERPARFELAVNLRTARTLGITVPQPLLLRADTVLQ